MATRKITASLGFILTGVVILSFMFPDFVTQFLGFDRVQDTSVELEEVELVRVIDGDTIVIQSDKDTEESVRLLLVDTPETVHPEQEEELFGKHARKFVESILEEGDTIYIERGEEQTDKYGRTLAYVFVEEPRYIEEYATKSVNAQLVRNGYARVAFVYDPNIKYVSKFRELEDVAQTEKLNIWSIRNYVTDEGFDMSVVSDDAKEEHNFK